MDKIYSRINWENYPSQNTAIDEDNLNKMDSAINLLDNRIISQETNKLSKEESTNDIVDWIMDEETGVITVTRRNGEKILFDLNVEKIPVSFVLSDDGILYMTTEDGTVFTANIGAMIPILTFQNSDEIAISVTGEGINKIYSFSIKESSITENKLQPNFLSDIKLESAKAEKSVNSCTESALNALDYSKKSESYAVGGTGTRDGENTDNAKYYNDQAKKTLSEMQKGQVTGVKGLKEEVYRTGNVELSSENIGAVPVGGEISENTINFESNDSANPTEWGNVEIISTGEKTKSLFNKISTMFKNIRYLYGLMGTTDISNIGDGTVRGAIGLLNSNLNNITIANVQISCLSAPMYFYKIGRLIQFIYPNDTAASVEIGNLGTVGTLTDDFKPYKTTQFVNFPLGATKIQLTFSEKGTITAYNYTGNAITQKTTCRYGGCYLSSE